MEANENTGELSLEMAELLVAANELLDIARVVRNSEFRRKSALAKQLIRDIMMSS